MALWRCPFYRSLISQSYIKRSSRFGISNRLGPVIHAPINRSPFAAFSLHFIDKYTVVFAGGVAPPTPMVRCVISNSIVCVFRFPMPIARGNRSRKLIPDVL